jgi:hypothetical protein
VVDKTALIFGASGACGEKALEALLARGFNVISCGRREYHFGSANSNKKLQQYVLDFSQLRTSLEVLTPNLQQVDILVWALGTTRSDCKDAAEYHQVECVYPQIVADFSAQFLQLKASVLLSSWFASPRSWSTYLRQKGEVEQYFCNKNWKRLFILKPGPIGRGEKARPMEKFISCLFPNLPCKTIGLTMAKLADMGLLEQSSEQVKILGNREIKAYASTL